MSAHPGFPSGATRAKETDTLKEIASEAPSDTLVSPHPPCPVCSRGMDAIDHNRRRWWLCEGCGVTMVRT